MGTLAWTAATQFGGNVGGMNEFEAVLITFFSQSFDGHKRIGLSVGSVHQKSQH
jgi:hypothetical protein